MKNENDDLAVNIIRHFDFSKVGIFAQTNVAPLPSLEDIDNLESLHSTLEGERDHFEMKLAAARERFSARVAETTGEGIESYVDKLDEITS